MWNEKNGSTYDVSVGKEMVVEKKVKIEGQGKRPMKSV